MGRLRFARESLDGQSAGEQSRGTAVTGSAGAERGPWFRPDIEGLRAVAIGAVLLYHAGVPGATGGFVGVDVFFVISGFLITGLLVREWSARGTIDLPAFYARRFRRLLPAALLAIVGHDARVVGHPLEPALPAPSPAMRRPRRSTSPTCASRPRRSTTWAQRSRPRPLLHFWSLGVEEQFYLFWPLCSSLRPASHGACPARVAACGHGCRVLRVGPRLDGHRGPLGLLLAAHAGMAARRRSGHRHRPHPPARSDARAAGRCAVGPASALIGAAVVLIGPATPYPGTGRAPAGPGHARSSSWAAAGAAWRRRASWARRCRVRSAASRTRSTCGTGRCSSSCPSRSGLTSLALDLALVAVAVVVAALSTELIETPIRQGRSLPLPPRRSLVVAGAASVAGGGRCPRRGCPGAGSRASGRGRQRGPVQRRRARAPAACRSRASRPDARARGRLLRPPGRLRGRLSSRLCDRRSARLLVWATGWR